MGLYYRGSKGGVIVYDVTSRSSFDKAKVWLKELRDAVGVPENVDVEEPGYVRNGIVLALAGNKRDLVEGKGAGGIRGEDLKLEKVRNVVRRPNVPCRGANGDELEILERYCRRNTRSYRRLEASTLRILNTPQRLF